MYLVQGLICQAGLSFRSQDTEDRWSVFGCKKLESDRLSQCAEIDRLLLFIMAFSLSNYRLINNIYCCKLEVHASLKLAKTEFVVMAAHTRGIRTSELQYYPEKKENYLINIPKTVSKYFTVSENRILP